MKPPKGFAFRVCVAVIAGVCVVAEGSPLAYSQTKDNSVAKSSDEQRTFPLTKFYQTANPLPQGKPGDLIRSQEFDRYQLPASVSAVRILYHSRSANGEDVAVSGVVLYPYGKAPSSGWPLIAWAHAFNGVARQCAPSLARNVQHGPFLAMYVSLGYAVVATDNAGLGTSGRSAFIDAESNATDIINSVPAARAAVPEIGSRWLAIGVGEGAPAVVGVAEQEHAVRDPNFLGAMAISGLGDLQDRYARANTQAGAGFPLFLAYGIKAIYAQFDPKEILTDKAVSLYSKLEQSCSPGNEVSKLPATEVLKPHWDSNNFVQQYFRRNTLGEKPAAGALLVLSSELDPNMPIQSTSQVIARMCKQGDRVQFEKYAQSDAGGIFGDSVTDQISWIQARFAGRPAASNCREQP